MSREPDAAVRQMRLASAAQQQALDAAATIWVDASAGSGKTKVLVDRVLALLLAGAKAERILCLTFTKAAAAEMANRLLARLSDWATLPDGALTEALYGLFGRPPAHSEEETARRLFARVLDTPGGLKIQTIHGFCQSLLARFPLEAGIAPGFAVLDERTSGELLSEAQNDLLAELDRPEQERLRAAVEHLLEAGDDQGLVQALGELVGRRALVEAALEHYGGAQGAIAAHRAALSLQQDDTHESLLTAALASPLLPIAGLRAALAALRQGGINDNKAADKLERFLGPAGERLAERYEDYRSCLLTDKNEPRSSVMTKSTAKAAPQAGQLLADEAQRIAALECRLAALRVAERAAALLELAAAVLGRYRRAQEARAALDYDDLIERTARLLADPERAAWVLYKLDGGLDHLLIDEAQDTSPAQWQVVRALTTEFYAGAGAHEERSPAPRTVFAVGDVKQSIFRFQGADPAGFLAAQRRFAEQAAAAEQAFGTVALTHSFRSVEAVLAAVDLTFAPPEMREGLVEGGRPISHRVTRLGEGGLVELWPLVEPPDATPEAPWTAPLERSPQQAPTVRLAEIVALTLRRWLQAAEGSLGPGHPGWLDSKGRPLAAGDILILVRRRDPLFWALVRQLKKHGIPVSGVDRMVLNEQQAVRDLIALGRFLLLPADDLTLAVVLKGPLFGLDDDDLIALACGRDGSLWQALGERRGLKPAYADAHRRLEALLAEADYRPPFEFFGELLAAGGARRQWLARLGEEASDPLDEFLAQALVYEREHAPSLEGFLDWLERGELQVKRDLESGGGAVRIMTVHGAKGLQAPVVLLPDSTQPAAAQESYLEDRGRHLLLPWTADTKMTALGRDLIQAEQQAVAQEYRRLLYVAMTRAEDRLYVMGIGKGAGKDVDAASWYACVRRALESAAQSVPLEGAAAALGAARRLSAPQKKRVEAAPAAAAREPLPLGGFARRAPPPEPTPPRPLVPSRPAAEEPATLSPLLLSAAPAAAGRGDPAQRFRRGLALHRLLQSLPELPPAERAAAARRYLALPGLGLSPLEQESWAAEALAVMATPGAAALFAPGSRAEVPLTGLVGSQRVAGQVDRLAVTPEAVLLVDYKTNRPPPEDESGVPALYWQQMAAYRALLRQIYPDRPVKAFLLWTDKARLMQLSDERLAASLP